MRSLTVGDQGLLGQLRSFRDVALELSPAGLWLFDESSGTTASDLSGNGRHLTLTNGPVQNAGGPLGRFVEFDGTNDYATGTGISFTGEWSAVAVIRPDAQAEAQIVGNWMSGTATQRWTLAMTATGIEAFSFNGGYSGFGHNVTLADGGWHIIGVSRRAGTNASNLYHQGASLGTGTIAAPLGSSTTEVGRKGGGSPYFNGGICGVAVFGAALTTAQHLALALAARLA